MMQRNKFVEKMNNMRKQFLVTLLYKTSVNPENKARRTEELHT